MDASCMEHASVSVVFGPNQGRTFDLVDDDPKVIGRHHRCLLRLTDAMVSREHAVLTRDDDGWYLSDLGSRNGTLVNGTPISQRTCLLDDDRIQVGTTILVFSCDGHVEVNNGAAQPRQARAAT